MKKGVFIFVVGLLAYVRSVTDSSETVWLKDVTTRFQTDKRTFSDLDLPGQLTFHLTRGSDVVTLNLKRNYEIDPNADIYVVQKLKDGRSYLAKTRQLEKEDVAYYQDRENGAFMTVRCVRRSNEQCDRVINGNIQIGDSNYDLRPVETDVTSRSYFKVPGRLVRRYVLQDQANIQTVENKDAAHVNDNNVEEEALAPLLHFLHGKDKNNDFARSDDVLSSRQLAGLHIIRATDKTRNLKRLYYVDVAVLIDAGLWDIYSSMVTSTNPLTKSLKVKNKIKEYYSHIMNGVNLRYKEIEDTSISISVILCKFIFFKHEVFFPYKRSKVTIVNGTKYIDAYKLLDDLSDWDKETGSRHLPIFDQAMLFTSHDLYKGSPSDNTIRGITRTLGVCLTGDRVSVIEAGDYVRTVILATHELGHSLGSWHDGEKSSIACKAEDLFIMTPTVPPVDPSRPYSRNPWIFSNCSVQAFKRILSFKQCVIGAGSVYDEQEWTTCTMKQPGEVYTPDEQCHVANGYKSKYCGTVPEEICHLMRCTDPKTRTCLPEYFSAARGTKCGENMWCIEGRCVSKASICSNRPNPQRATVRHV